MNCVLLKLDNRLIILVLLVFVEVLLFSPLLPLRSLHLLLVDLQQGAEEGRVLTHEVSELRLKILLLGVPLFDLRLCPECRMPSVALPVPTFFSLS